MAIKIKLGFFGKLLLPIAIKIIGNVAKKTTPEIREELVKFVLEWEKKCKASKNSWDDIIVYVLKGILEIN